MMNYTAYIKVKGDKINGIFHMLAYKTSYLDTFETKA